MLGRVTPVYDKWYTDTADRTPQTVLDAAHAAGVSRMLCIGTTLADSRQAIDLAEQQENVWASIGIHPHEASDHTSHTSKSDFASLLEGRSTTSKIVAVGECGLDYFYTHSPKDEQIELLKFQIELALKYDVPLSFHVREAFDDFWPVFDSYQGANIRGVLHSFTDNLENMDQAIKRGLYFGVNGIATFGKKTEDHVIYRTIPQQLLLLETDAPFLTPAPFRGKVCESKHVRVTAEYLAGLRDISLEDLAASTTANARKLFKV